MTFTGRTERGSGGEGMEPSLASSSGGFSMTSWSMYMAWTISSGCGQWM